MQPLCPGTQIIPPVMPVNLNMNNQPNAPMQNNIQQPNSFQQPNMNDEENIPPQRPRCPGTQIIPPVMPVNLNMNNQPNAPMQNNNPNNAQPNQNNQPPNSFQQPNMNDEEYVPPTRPRCPATQPIPPVIPANMLFNNNPTSSSPNNNNHKFGQWNNSSPKNNSNSNTQSPSPPQNTFQRSIPVQLIPDLIPKETPNQNLTQPQEIDFKSIFEEIFPEPILPPFPVGETGGEYIIPTETDETIELPADINSGEGQLKVIARTASNAFPVKDAIVIIEKTFPDGSTEVISSLKTNSSGVSPTISLSAPPKKYSLVRQSKVLPFSYYDVLVSATGYYKMIYKNVPIFDDVQSVQPVDMIPVSLDITNTDRIVRFVDTGE